MDKDTAINGAELRAIRVSVAKIDGNLFVDVRDCVVEDGDLVPTPNGLTIKLELLPSLVEQLALVELAASKKGVLQKEAAPSVH